ncbi:hypothetical protein [Arthrobacter sp. ISL-95]|uniref:hypothetical protein n=1 Tax=Arthrobacter sp. ISL-95 TaxID=2819116 RepID=UPI001BE86D3C|nr:hypothetical protein [Arthrobacter sp. ISL-95]MBT2587965.1 hypothetical protein [Arthrobacter sp. ISL-95]
MIITPVSIVRPSRKETAPGTLVAFFVALPLFALLLWAAFLGVANDLFNVELTYWQCLLLILGWKALNFGNPTNLFTSKHPDDA